MTHPSRPAVLALLHESKEHPHDPTPRQILADLLEDSGNDVDAARGEFLRLHCRLAGMRRQDPERPQLEARSRHLLQQYEADWLGPLLALDLLHAWRWQDGLLCLEVEKARLLSREVRELAGCAALAWVEGIRLNAPLDVILRCLTSPLLQGVRRLNLRGNRLTPGDLEILFAAPALARFTHLDLQDVCLGGSNRDYGLLNRNYGLAPNPHPGVRALAQSPHLKGLTWLNLTETGVGLDSVECLASSDLGRLVHLDLSLNWIGAPTLNLLSESRSLTGLTSLRMCADKLCRDDDWHDRRRGWEALPDLPGLARLTHLDLSLDTVSYREMPYLASAPGLAGLTHLSLIDCWIDDSGARALANSPFLNKLIELDLSKNRISEPAQQALRERFGSAVIP